MTTQAQVKHFLDKIVLLKANVFTLAGEKTWTVKDCPIALSGREHREAAGMFAEPGDWAWTCPFCGAFFE